MNLQQQKICILDLNYDDVIDVSDLIIMVDLILNQDNILALNEQLSKLGITFSKEALSQVIDGNLEYLLN